MRISLKYSGTKYYTLGGELLDYGLIAIYDKDAEYAHSLANYFRIKGCLSSEIVVFTRDTAFLEFVMDHSIDILLIEQEHINTVANLSITNNLFILSKERMLETLYLKMFYNDASYWEDHRFLEKTIKTYYDVDGNITQVVEREWKKCIDWQQQDIYMRQSG